MKLADVTCILGRITQVLGDVSRVTTTISRHRSLSLSALATRWPDPQRELALDRASTASYVDTVHARYRLPLRMLV
jgi:hypothetical protein